MEKKIEISFHNMPPSEALERRIHKKIDKLLTKFPFLEKVRVMVDSPHHHKQKGNLYQLRIDMHIPGQELIVNKQPGGKMQAHENPYTTVNSAFKAATHRLEKHAQHLQGKTKLHPEHPHGTIVRLEDDFGFIRSPLLPEIYFHKNAVVEGKFKELKKGDAVHFEVDPDDPKNPHATFVKATSHHFLLDDMQSIRVPPGKE